MEIHNVKLLLVEDDSIIRNVYQQLIGQFVSHVLVAANGEEGYEMFVEHQPDIILTDIKMPVMNGLDMINKIRLTDKQVRVVIMSAYGESRFFLKAIESGVKGFLIKPINNNQLYEVIREQIREVLLEKSLREEEQRRQVAERERDKSENILKVLNYATAMFLTKGVSAISINDALSKIGEITKVSRVYIFKKEVFERTEVVSQIYEWVAKGIEPQLDNEELVNIPIHGTIFHRWAAILTNRQNVTLIVRMVENVDEREVMESQGIKSVLAIPIFVKNEWWGFIGFDDCLEERIWTESETYTLGMLAFNLGGAIYRRNVEDQLNQLNANLEKRVKQRTLALEQEVAERTFTEELLRESEEKYRLIYENANDGIILVKQQMVFLVNPKVSDIFQAMPREIIGKRFSDFFLPEYAGMLNNLLDQSRADDVAHEEELFAESVQHKWIGLKVSFIVWDNDPSHLVFISDITKRRVAEKELFELNTQLEARVREEISRVEQQQQLLVQKSKIESIGELSAGLAHEINQPLVGISMGLENIHNKLVDNSLKDDYLKNKINMLFKDIERIQNIINHVRIFSRDQEKLEMEVVDIPMVIGNALSLVTRQFMDHEVDLRTCIPDGDFFTHGNGFRLEQVLLNVLSNAKYAVEERGKLKHEQYNKLIMISLDSVGDKNVIIIEDNGIGIDSKIIHQIFNPFFTTKSEEKGTGLGLSISYGIIKEMQGDIRVESEVGLFTKVFITLPKV